jgi:hypothetical protein
MTATSDARQKPSTAIGLRYTVNVVVIVSDVVSDQHFLATLAPRRLLRKRIVGPLNLNHFLVSDLAKVLSEVSDSVRMIIFGQLLVAGVYLGLARPRL